MSLKKASLLFSFFSFVILGCQGHSEATLSEIADIQDQEQTASTVPESELEEQTDHEHYDDGLSLEELIFPYGCTRASSFQSQEVQRGNALAEQFISACVSATGSNKWCQQIRRPNPSSKSTFTCTYGSNFPHQLINPDRNTWGNAFKAINLVVGLEKQGIQVAEIYNWWRPEPYNENVGGAAGRHPYGTSVDVRFSTMKDMSKAHAILCKWRAQGSLRALGYYGSTGLHLGIGDKAANTWGKSCP